MNTMTSTRRFPRVALIAPLVLSSLALAPHARAETLVDSVSAFTGTQSTSDSFTVNSAGTVSVTLRPIDWSVANGSGGNLNIAMVDALSFSASSATALLGGGSISSATLAGCANSGGSGCGQQFQFDVGGAGTYYANIMAEGAGVANLGVYSIEMMFTPNGTPSVPLPASGWLLLTGIFVLVGLARTVRPFELMGTVGA
jgi:hypothetical protein